MKAKLARKCPTCSSEITVEAEDTKNIIWRKNIVEKTLKVGFDYFLKCPICEHEVKIYSLKFSNEMD